MEKLESDPPVEPHQFDRLFSSDWPNGETASVKHKPWFGHHSPPVSMEPLVPLNVKRISLLAPLRSVSLCHAVILSPRTLTVSLGNATYMYLIQNWQQLKVMRRRQNGSPWQRFTASPWQQQFAHVSRGSRGQWCCVRAASLGLTVHSTVHYGTAVLQPGYQSFPRGQSSFWRCAEYPEELLRQGCYSAGPAPMLTYESCSTTFPLQINASLDWLINKQMVIWVLGGGPDYCRAETTLLTTFLMKQPRKWNT